MKRLSPLLLFGLIALAGCSQTGALAPVGGNRLTLVRFAALDVLIAQNVQLLQAPVCELTGQDVTCTGETAQHKPVLVASPVSDEQNMTVTVAGRTFYTGSIQGVLDSAIRPTS